MDWKHLTRISDGARLVVERIRLPDTGIVVEGSFELPPLAQLSIEDQVFVAAFVKSHGSIKEMERLFGVSYPTIKSRLNRARARLRVSLARRGLAPSFAMASPAVPARLLEAAVRVSSSPSIGGASAHEKCGITFSPPIAVTASRERATVNVSNGALSSLRRESGPGTVLVLENTSNGPAKSSTSTSSKIRMPTVSFMISPVWSCG